MVANGPVFISYSRKDYYFAESLALHLQRYRVPVWLDAKDLQPGADWQQQLESALDNASCVLVVVSADSVKRPVVRMEWERARKNGTRIIVVQFRKARLPQELQACELVDFRSSFKGPLRALIQRLAGVAPDASHTSWLPVPPWVLVVTLTLLIPLLCYFALANWGTQSMNSEWALWVFAPIAGFVFLWFLCLAFLRRKMGMTHLAVSFAFPAIWCVYPLTRFWLAGPAHVPDTWLRVIERNPMPMELGSAVTLAGIGIVLLLRPDDLLRWTPTGKVWGFYRQGCLAGLAGVDRPSALRQVERYRLLHDAVDGPAAKRLRRELGQLGATEAMDAAPDDTAILLLTSRTHTDWLNKQTDRLQGNVMTVVGTRIGLPEQLEWLWKREWIDFRHWDLRRLDQRRGLLQVPEAVTGIRYPREVRVVHQLLCAMTGLAFCLLPLGDPGFNQRPSGEDTPGEDFAAVVIFAICLWFGVLAQRLLNRTVSQAGFDKGWKIGLAAVSLAAVWALPEGAGHGADWWQLLPFAGYLIAFPFSMNAMREKVAFWFPTPGMGRPGAEARLKTGRQWQTLLWAGLYLFVFGLFAGMYKD